MKLMVIFRLGLAVFLSGNVAMVYAANRTTYDNELAVDVGMSVQNGGFEPKYHGVTLNYSQPNTFFRQQGRRNIHIGYYGGYYGGEDSKDNLAGVTLLGLSQDVIFGGEKYYGFLGLGAFISDDGTERIGSKFVFRERLGLGYRFEKYTMELFFMHYSNGTLQEPNIGENFLSFSFGWRY